jgi:Protein of unknown function (DUF3574)
MPHADGAQTSKDQTATDLDDAPKIGWRQCVRGPARLSRIFKTGRAPLRKLAPLFNPPIVRPAMLNRRFLLPLVPAAAALALSSLSPLAARAGEEHHCRVSADAQAFARTELFFGLSRPGGVITEADFQAFVDARVTPRFPDGLTLLSGSGQFREAGGTILVEGAKVLVLLYPRRDRQADAKIEQIRSDYKVQFQQQSVLRSDETACVSF